MVKSGSNQTSDTIERLVDALREELLEHGELLALLHDQRSLRASGPIAKIEANRVAARNQSLVIRQARSVREQCCRELAQILGLQAGTGVAEMARLLPDARGAVLRALCEGIRACEARSQRAGIERVGIL